MNTNDIIITDYGVVTISARSMKWLNSIDPEWREIHINTRRRGKHAKYVRAQLLNFETAVIVAAAIAWTSGEVLRKF